LAVPDHLVLAARDLDQGAAWLEDRLGVPLADGGRHTRMGTCNRLLGLGEGLYLELIAIDPQAPPPGRPRWFGLDRPEDLPADRPRLTWVARSDDIGAKRRPAQKTWARSCHGARRLSLAHHRAARWPPAGRRPGADPDPVGCPFPSAVEAAGRGLPVDEAGGLSSPACAHQDGAVAARPGVAARCASCGTDEAPQLVAYVRTPRGLVELD
jgi:hypothetical protein